MNIWVSRWEQLAAAVAQKNERKVITVKLTLERHKSLSRKNSTGSIGLNPGTYSCHKSLVCRRDNLYRIIKCKSLNPPQVPGQSLSISAPLSVNWRQSPLSAEQVPLAFRAGLSSQGGPPGPALFCFGIQVLFLHLMTSPSSNFNLFPSLQFLANTCNISRFFGTAKFEIYT